MEGAAFVDQMQAWANTVLVWIGFGTVVGLLAKAIMPGRDPGGAVVNLALGVGGTVIGCGALTFFAETHVTPISPLGFAVATAGALGLLVLYRLMAGMWLREGTVGPRWQLRRPNFLRRRRPQYVEVE